MASKLEQTLFKMAKMLEVLVHSRRDHHRSPVALDTSLIDLVDQMYAQLESESVDLPPSGSQYPPPPPVQPPYTPKDGFKVLKGYSTPRYVQTDLQVTAVGITKDLPPSTIQLEYAASCTVRYRLNNKAGVGYCFNGNVYEPVEPRLLRFSDHNGPVTSDWVECRVTIMGDGSGNFELGVEAAPPRPPGLDMPRLMSNQQTWEALGIRDYRFGFNWSCYCAPGYADPVIITVTDGEISWIVRVADGIEVVDHAGYKTLDGLFDYLVTQHSNGAHHISVTYDPKYGYPTEGFVDQISRAVDDEISFSVRDFRRMS